MSGRAAAMPGFDPPLYSRAMRALHWLTAALLLGPYLAILAIGYADNKSGAIWLIMLHRSFGLVILALTLLRLAARRRSTIPPLPAGMPGMQRLAAELSAAGLYALLIAQPLLGLLATMVHGDRATVFGSLLLPRLLPVNRPLGRELFALHGFIGLALLGLIALHALAALHHHFVRRDMVLVGMLPSARKVFANRRTVANSAPVRRGLS